MTGPSRSAASAAFAPRPGDRNFVADLRPSSLLGSPDRCLMRAPLTEHVTSAAGSASVGMLLTLVDLAASYAALASCRPDWTATQNLSLHSARPLTAGPIVLDARIVRIGSKSVVVATDVYDGRGEEDFDVLHGAIAQADGGGTAGPSLAGTGLVTFARLPRPTARGVDDYDPAQWVGQVRHPPTDAAVEGTIYDRLGFRVLDARTGRLELDRTRYVSNTIGTINGGAQAVLIEAAAEAARPGMVASDLQIHYLAQLKTGPARTATTVVRDAADHTVMDVALLDGGNDDEVITLGTVTLRRAEPWASLAG